MLLENQIPENKMQLVKVYTTMIRSFSDYFYVHNTFNILYNNYLHLKKKIFLHISFLPKHKNFSKAVKIHYSLSFKSANCTLSFIQTTFFLIVTTLARKVVFKEMRWYTSITWSLFLMRQPRGFISIILYDFPLFTMEKGQL